MYNDELPAQQGCRQTFRTKILIKVEKASMLNIFGTKRDLPLEIFNMVFYS